MNKIWIVEMENADGIHGVYASIKDLINDVPNDRNIWNIVEIDMSGGKPIHKDVSLDFLLEIQKKVNERGE